jgi:hypothetical protein
LNRDLEALGNSGKHWENPVKAKSSDAAAKASMGQDLKNHRLQAPKPPSAQGSKLQLLLELFPAQG